MKQHLTFCATLVALSVGTIASAGAQPYYYGAPRPPAYVGPRMYSPALPPHEILAIVRASGLVPLSQPVRRGPRAYAVVAAGRDGEQMRVIVDAYAGDIRRVNPMVAMRPYGAPPVAAYPYDPRTRGAMVEREVSPPGREIRAPHAGAYPPAARYQPGTISPRAISPRTVPNARVATAPSVNPQTPAAKPQHAPLPRPRPNVAAATPTPQASVPSPAAAPTPPAQAAPAPATTPETTPPKTEAPAMAPVTPLD